MTVSVVNNRWIYKLLNDDNITAIAGGNVSLDVNRKFLSYLSHYMWIIHEKERKNGGKNLKIIVNQGGYNVMGKGFDWKFSIDFFQFFTIFY